MTPPAPSNGDASTVIDIPAAVAITVASNGSDAPVVAWSDAEAVRIARVDLPEFELLPELVASGSLIPVAHVIERPAVSVGADNVVHVAFTSFEGAGGTVHYVDVVDGQATSPLRISGDPRPETNLPHMTLGDTEPALAWLEDSTLSVALSRDGVPTEIENVDDLTCDCCNPVPVRVGDQLTVLYRNLEDTPDGVVRDVFSTTTFDGGATFATPVRVSDDHWYLDGCPFSGPAVVEAGEALIVSWMDARQSRHPDQDATTMWVDRSTDGGATFGVDVALTDGGIHRWPSLTLDGAGRVHLVWETQGADGGISYSSSDDAGTEFAAPYLLIPSTDGSGSPSAPTAITHGGHLLVSWIDAAGGHVARFALSELQ